MTTSSRIDTATREAASEWLVRRQDAGWSAQDEAALQAWLAADTQRRHAFDALSRTWTDFSGVPRPVLASEQRRATATRFFRTRRTLVPAALALGVMLLAGAWYRWDHTPGYTLELATGAGETRQLELPDGSRIDINVASRLTLRYYPRRREAVLDRGEAFFQVAPDAGKPFTVDSGASRVTVVGTRFNVRAAPPRLEVKVQEGRVQVLPDRTRPAQVLALAAAQGLAVDPSSGTALALAVAPDTVGDWRSGRLVFRRTPLAEVVQDVARYLGVPVVLQGGNVLATLQVSGYADVRAPATFLEALPDLLPVRVSRRADGAYLVTAR